MKISVVIPTYNEIATGYLQRSVPRLCQSPHIELIVVDRYSSDGTLEFLQNFPLKLINSKANTRAERLNEGLHASTGEWVLLHHPRSLLDLKAVEALLDLPAQVNWGAFTHKFDKELGLLNFTSWYSNKIRGDLRGIYYLDHCLFFQKSLFDGDPSPLPPVDIFEDTELCKKLLNVSQPVRLDFKSTTSAIRFVENGPWKQGLLNQAMKLAYFLGLPKSAMNRIYEAGLSLNSRY